MATELEATHPATHRRITTLLKRMHPRSQTIQLPGDLVTLTRARHGLSTVVLPEGGRATCAQLVAEHARTDELAAFALVPRHRLLLMGPPGNGKTMLAEAMAHELDVPFLSARHGGIIASYMGETGKNIDRLIDYASTAPCVLFIDEFDGVAIDRAKGSDVGEIRRVTNHLLIALEKLCPSTMLICATNADNLLDKAIRRRFDVEVQLPVPTRELRVQCARQELAPELTPGHDMLHLVEQIADLDLSSLYYVSQLCRRIRRDLVLNAGDGIQTILQGEVVAR